MWTDEAVMPEPTSIAAGAVAAKKLALPFFILAASGAMKPNLIRITEGLLIAVLTGAITSVAVAYVLTQRLDERMKAMEGNQERIEHALDAIRADIYRPVWLEKEK